MKLVIISGILGILTAFLTTVSTHLLMVRYERNKAERKREDENRRALQAQLTRGASELAERWEYSELADAIQTKLVWGAGSEVDVVPLWLRLAIVGCILVLAAILGFWPIIAIAVFYFSAFFTRDLLSIRLSLGSRLRSIQKTTVVAEAQGPVVGLFRGIVIILDVPAGALRFVFQVAGGLVLALVLVAVVLGVRFGLAVLFFLGVLAACIGLGFLLDYLLGSSPCIMIVGILIGLAVGIALAGEFVYDL